MSEETNPVQQIQQKYVTRWMMKAVTMEDNEQLQQTLDEGFEPFAITTKFVPGKTLDVKGGAAITPVSVIFFKQSYQIPVDENGKEQVLTLFKRKPNEVEPEPA